MPDPDSLFAAIEGNLAGMSHSDLVLTCQMLERGRAQWRKEAEDLKAQIDAAHAVMDADESKIIRNAKDGYPEGREPRELTLAERVKALCRYGADYSRWLREAEIKTGMKFP